jgi:hypothetical protein
MQPRGQTEPANSVENRCITVHHNAASALPVKQNARISERNGSACGGNAKVSGPLVIGGITLHGSVGAPNHWDEAISLHQRGLVKTEGIVTHHIELRDFAEGIAIMRERRDNAIKVMIELSCTRRRRGRKGLPRVGTMDRAYSAPIVGFSVSLCAQG